MATILSMGASMSSINQAAISIIRQSICHLEELYPHLPFLETVLRRTQQLYEQMHYYHHELLDLGLDEDDIADLICTEASDEQLLDCITSLKVLIPEFEKQLEALANIGCEIADLDEGRIDWHVKLDTQPICLCWQLGQKRIHHWRDESDPEKARYPIRSLRKVSLTA